MTGYQAPEADWPSTCPEHGCQYGGYCTAFVLENARRWAQLKINGHYERNHPGLDIPNVATMIQPS